MILRNTRPTHDPYQLAARALGIESSADKSEVQTAYRRVAHDTHPDINAGKPNPALLNAKFRLATAARALLLARSGNQDVRPLLKDFQSAQTWYDQEAQKVREAAPPPPPPGTQAGPKPGPRPTGAGFQSQGRAQSAGNADAFKNARSWVPPEFSAEDANVHRSHAGGRRSATSDEAQKARAWTPPDLDDLKEQARARSSAHGAAGEAKGPAGASTSGPAGGPAPGAAPHGQARAEKPQPEPRGSTTGAFDPDDWNLGTPFGSAGPSQASRAEAAPQAEARPEPAPAEPERPTMSEAEVKRRKAQVNAYARPMGSDNLGRHINLEI